MQSCISQFIHPSKPIREKYPNFLKMHKIENLVLTAEAEKTIRRNSGVSNVYTFSHADFEGVEYCATRRYVSLSKKVIEEDLFVSDENKYGNEVLPVSELPLLVEQRLCDVEIW